MSAEKAATSKPAFAETRPHANGSLDGAGTPLSSLFAPVPDRILSGVANAFGRQRRERRRRSLLIDEAVQQLREDSAGMDEGRGIDVRHGNDTSGIQTDSKLPSATEAILAGAGIGLAALAIYRANKSESDHSRRNAVITGLVSGAVLAGGDGLRTVLLDHRTNTHHSTELHPKFRKFLNFMGRSLLVGDPRRWPDAHLDHHQFPDASIFPFVRISRALDWVDKQREAGIDVGVEIPTHFFHLDPGIEEGKYTQEEVRIIGKRGEDYVKEKLGDLYTPPETYTPEELKETFYAQGPDYHYKKYKKRKRGEWTSDELATAVLQDPHSPLYADTTGRNGVGKILRWGFWPYMSRNNVSGEHPEIISPHAQHPDDEIKSVWPAVTTVALLPGVAVLIGGGSYKDAAVASAISTGTRIVYVGAGSMAVNGWGHPGGDTDPGYMRRSAFDKDFRIRPNADGEFSADFQPRGFFSWAINALSDDEIFNQGHHHRRPRDVVYSIYRGLKGVIQAPVGMGIEAVVKSNSGLINPGDQFGLEPGERRPDEPHPAMELITAARIRQYERDQAELARAA